MRDVLATVTPSGGKSLLPVLAAQALIAAGVCERICWMVPRDSLRLQAEEVFADPAWRQTLGLGLLVRAAGDALGNPCQGLAGYHDDLSGNGRNPGPVPRCLLVVDKVRHLPGLNEMDAAGGRDGPLNVAAAWSAPIELLLALLAVRLLLSGTLERADGRRILWSPYRWYVKCADAGLYGFDDDVATELEERRLVHGQKGAAVLSHGPDRPTTSSSRPSFPSSGPRPQRPCCSSRSP